MTAPNRISIRPERPEEYSAVEHLTREAFWNVNVPGCDEHYLAHVLRGHPDFLPALDFVAELDGILAGNIMFARSVVADETGVAHPVLTFGPLSVLPSRQKQGVGAALIRHACAAARALGHGAVLIYGDPAYYSRLGFRPAEAFFITTGEGDFHPALQALELLPGALSAIRGRFLESPAYHLDPARAAVFEEAFPPKEKFVTESQRRFARLAGLPVPD